MWDKILHRSWLRLERYYHFTESENILHRLKQAYSEPQRAYHTLQHLGECLLQFEQVQTLLEDAPAVELALWFHDAVYDPKASDNEEKSADLFKFLLKNDLNVSVISKVYTWIIATKQHQPSPDQDLNILLDIDLAILGADVARFKEYEQQIRQEYSWVDAGVYRIKRTQVLAYFYKQNPLYQSRFFQQRLEEKARYNLALYLDR